MVFNSREDWQPPFAAEPIHLEMNLRNTRPVGDVSISPAFHVLMLKSLKIVSASIE